MILLKKLVTRIAITVAHFFIKSPLNKCFSPWHQKSIFSPFQANIRFSLFAAFCARKLLLTNYYINKYKLFTFSSKYKFLFSWQHLCEKIIRKIYFRWFQAQTDRKILDVGERKFAVSKQEILNLFKGLSLEIET